MGADRLFVAAVGRPTGRAVAGEQGVKAAGPVVDAPQSVLQAFDAILAHCLSPIRFGAVWGEK